MTGSAFKRWTFCLYARAFTLVEWEGGLGEGGKKFCRGGAWRIFFSVFFAFFFECVFRGGPEGVFFCFGCFLASLGESLFKVFLKSVRFSRKGW